MDNGRKSVNEMILLFQQRLALRYPEQEIMSFLYLLFDDLMGWSRATIHLNRGKILSEEVNLRFLEVLDRLIEGEPIQYIIGHTEFCGLTLGVQRGVLIPRPETEELAVMATRDNLKFRDKAISILDIGTGSGCLALAMKKAFPTANVTGIDISADAIAVARKNALANQLEVDFSMVDILSPSIFLPHESYHIIISNPPYIPENERPTISPHIVNHEPEESLFVPNYNPLIFYDAIASFAKGNLKPDGKLYTEIHESFGDATVNLFRAHGFTSVELFKDYFGKDRFVKASEPL